MTEERPDGGVSKQRLPRQLVAYYCAASVLLVGLLTAALVYVFAIDDSDAEAAAELASARMYQHNLELMGGKFAVYVDEFNRWFASLWHGRTLAYTIAILAVAIALVCIWIGGLSAGQRDDA